MFEFKPENIIIVEGGSGNAPVPEPRDGYRSPNEGGCWFCSKGAGPMLFTVEWDSNFHLQCLLDALPCDEEAVVIAREFGLRGY